MMYSIKVILLLKTQVIYYIKVQNVLKFPLTLLLVVVQKRINVVMPEAATAKSN